MITAHIHAELIAAFLGDDEPCYGECRCAPCIAARPNPYEGTMPRRAATLPRPGILSADPVSRSAGRSRRSGY